MGSFEESDSLIFGILDESCIVIGFDVWTVSFDQAAVWCDSWLLSDGNGMLQKILVEEIDDGSRQKIQPRPATRSMIIVQQSSAEKAIAMLLLIVGNPLGCKSRTV